MTSANTESVSSPTVPTRQEMFDRAVRGLRSQGFARCTLHNMCSYDDGQGHHCAWGWVDRGIPSGAAGSVMTLKKSNIGIAALLSDKDLDLAQALQNAHDLAEHPADLESRLRAFGEKYGLVWPEGHWPDCAVNHGGNTCDMGPECGSEDGAP